MFDTDYLLFGFCVFCLSCLVIEIDEIRVMVAEGKGLVLVGVFCLRCLVLVGLDDGCICVCVLML